MPEKAARAAPLLRLRSQFIVPMVFVHHPLRLTVSLLIPFFLLPELQQIVVFTTGLTGQAAHFAAVMGVILVIFLPQLLAAALNCQKVTYDFFAGHLSFTESFFLREPVTIPYRSITAGQVKASWVQRFFGIADIVLTVQPQAGRLLLPSREQRIPDIRAAEEALQKIENILKAGP